MYVGVRYIDQLFVRFDIYVMVIFHVGVEIGAPRIDDDFAQQAGIGELVQSVVDRGQRQPGLPGDVGHPRVGPVSEPMRPENCLAAMARPRVPVRVASANNIVELVMNTAIPMPASSSSSRNWV